MKKKKRILTEEQKQALRERLAKARAVRDQNLASKREKSLEEITHPPEQDLVPQPNPEDIVQVIGDCAITKPKFTFGDPRSHCRIEPAEQDLTVTRFPLNPVLIHAKDSAGKEQTVWVGRNENYVMGMKIKAVPHPTQKGLLQVVGPNPRWKGDTLGGRAFV